MTGYERYALYVLPEAGALADWTAAWLGWDVQRGATVPHPDIPDLPATIEEMTAAPRRYGFHATVKPPFYLSDGSDPDGLDAAVSRLCSRLAPVALDGLQLSRISGFLALTPLGDVTTLNAFAANTVRELDDFRAPPDAKEIARRRAGNLSAAQEANLAAWGYPYVMGEFSFHMTLTGRMPEDQGGAVQAALQPILAPLLPQPFLIETLCLAGQDSEGMFHMLHRYHLGD
ncbi:MAG: DUF1045 domain-containing protein [Pseudomonadota bacterium]